jgi:hypothetical protein
MENNIKDKVVFASPRTEEERAFAAGACVRKLGIEFPAVLDEFGNSTERAYTGRPDRIYLIDQQGRVAYKSKPGPFGFKPDQLAMALSRALPIGANLEKSIGHPRGPDQRPPQDKKSQTIGLDPATACMTRGRSDELIYLRDTRPVANS